MPKATVDGLNPNADCTPAPLMAITAFDPCEDVTVTFPLTFSAVAGEKDTVMTFACPGARATGVVMPLVCKSFAVVVICEIVTLVFPLFVKVTLLELELPALIPPNASCTGFAVSVNDAETPVPLNATFAGELGALLEIATVPPRFPEAVGANSAINDALCPAASEAGVVSPLTL